MNIQPAPPSHRPAGALSPALRDVAAHLIEAGVPLPRGWTLPLPKSADQCRHILAFARHCSERLNLRHAENDDHRRHLIGTEIGLMLQHGVGREALQGAIALCKAGVLPQHPPEAPPNQLWPHYLARHGFEPAGGFHDTARDNMMSLRERFAALAAAGFSLRGTAHTPPPILAAVEADNTATLLTLLESNEALAGVDDLLLHHAASHDASAVFGALTERQFSTLAPNREGDLALHIAAADGSMGVLPLTIAGISIDEQSASGDTALHLAARHGQTGAVRWLLAHGAQCAATDAHGNTPAHLAARHGQDEVLSVLLDHRPELARLANHTGDTPMHQSARFGQIASMEKLRHADPNAALATNHRGSTPLHLAAEAGRRAAVEWLLALAPEALNVEDLWINTPIFLAARRGHTDIVRIMNKHPQLDRSIGSNTVEALLEPAAAGGHLTMLRELAATPGFDINAPEILSIGILWAKPRLVAGLLQIPGIDANRRDHIGETPLHLAARVGRLDMVSILLKAPAIDAAAVTPRGRTALHLAAITGRDDIVRLLIDDGRIKIDARGHDGRTAAELAARRGFSDIQDMLEPPPKPATSHRGRAVEPSPHVDINAKNQDGLTALQLAVSNHETPLLKALLTHPGIDVNARGPQGNTALHLAALHGAADTLKMLSALPDIDLNARNRQGRTPLHLAAANGNPDVVRLLIADRRTKPALRSADGHDARSLARQAGHLDIVEVLRTLPAFQKRSGWLSGIGTLFDWMRTNARR